MNLHVFQHVEFEGPGCIAAWALDRGCRLTTTRLYQNEPLPDMNDVDGLIVLGGPMNVYQTDEFPWLQGERDYLHDFVSMGAPVLGICLGAQLLADALGARVYPHHCREIGWTPVDFTTDARRRFPGLPTSRSVLHWHGDTYELPRGARRLAHGKWCPEQGFLWAEHVLALQFHLEAGAEECGLFVEHGQADLLEPGATVQSAEEIYDGANLHAADARDTLHLILDEFFAPVLRHCRATFCDRGQARLLIHEHFSPARRH